MLPTEELGLQFGAWEADVSTGWWAMLVTACYVALVIPCVVTAAATSVTGAVGNLQDPLNTFLQERLVNTAAVKSKSCDHFEHS
jgi:hypothetical protein